MPRALLLKKPKFKEDSKDEMCESVSENASVGTYKSISVSRQEQFRRARIARNLVLQKLRRSRRQQLKRFSLKVETSREVSRIQNQNKVINNSNQSLKNTVESVRFKVLTDEDEVEVSEDDENNCTTQRHFIKWMKKDGRTRKVWECGICNKEFIHQYTLMRHLPIHTGERNFKCDVCDKAFRQASTLCRHKAIHSDARPFLCSVCGKAFNRSSTLIAHRKTHSDMKKHVCHVCGKGFHQKGNLKNHIYTHTGERPYKCDKCERGFNQISNLMCHKAHAHVEKPKLICQLCGKEFPRKFSLRCHEEYKHGIKYNGEHRINVDSFKLKELLDQRLRRGRPGNCNTSKTVILPNGDKTIKFLNNHIFEKQRRTLNTENQVSDSMLINEESQSSAHVTTDHAAQPQSLLETTTSPSVAAPIVPFLSKSTGILIDPINTPAMLAAQSNGQTPFALLRPTKGVPVLVKILSTVDGKQVLVPASSEDLKDAGRVVVSLENGEKKTKTVQIKVPVVANITQKTSSNGFLIIEIEPIEEQQEKFIADTQLDLATSNMSSGCAPAEMEVATEELNLDCDNAVAIQVENSDEVIKIGNVNTDEVIQDVINITRLNAS